MKFNILAVTAGILALAGCGISDDTLLTDIDADLWSKVCSKVAEAQPEETITCDGVEFTTAALTEAEHETACNDAWSDSSTWTDCTATFGDWIDFNEYEPADPCVPDANPPGVAAFQCVIDNM